MAKHKVIFVSEDQIEDYDSFVCSSCNKHLVHEGYKINQKTIFLLLTAFFAGFLLGVFILL